MKLLIYGLTALLCFLLDRISKIIAIDYVSSKALTSNLSFSLHINKGIAFGFFSEQKGSFFLLNIVIVILILIFSWYWYVHMYVKNRSHQKMLSYVYSIFLSCSFSNLLDRFVYGGVIDFIEVSFFGISFPIFNFADVGIVFSILFFFYYEFCMLKR